MAPIYPETTLPKLIADINKAYIVPSIFFGHILHAKTKIGIVFNSPTT